jgi:hypothetical protein
VANRFDYLALGHITLDRQPDGSFLPGGTVTYGGIQAARLGLHTGILTAGNPADFVGPLEPYHDELTIEMQPTLAATVFVNVGSGAARRQTVEGWAGVIDLSRAALDARIIHLAPVARELDVDRLPEFLPETFVGATPQGWLRSWGADGHVREGELMLPTALTQRLDALVMSDSEAPKTVAASAAVRAAGGIVVVTRGAAGCTLYLRDGECDVPAIHCPVVDDTGAGDIFAAAFFVALTEGQSPVEAARFANAAAGLSIGGRGVAGIARRAAVEQALGEEEAARGEEISS